jgi:hypothetical protein
MEPTYHQNEAQKVCAGILVNGAGLAYSYELAAGRVLQPWGYAHLVGQPCAFILIIHATQHNVIGEKR